jgi:hypothetical protein
VVTYASTDGYAATMPGMPDSEPGTRSESPHYRQAVVDLLGVLAYAEITAFQRLAADVALAPTVADKAALGQMAVREFAHFRQVHDHLQGMGVDPQQAMFPFMAALDEFHAQTAPSSYLEGLVKAYVGDGIAVDFYREVAQFVDEDTRALVLDVLSDAGHADFVVEKVRGAIEADPTVGGRLALWARRLVGEALSQAQRVAAQRDALASLIVGGIEEPGTDLAEIGRMLARLTDAHTKRMSTLGLSA